jgi:hypothetical protein
MLAFRREWRWHGFRRARMVRRDHFRSLPMPRSRLCLASSVALAALFGGAAFAAPVPSYTVSQSIAGPDGGWDYASVDPQAGQLYVARATNVTVIDLATQKVAASIGAISKGHAVVPLPGSPLLLVTSGKDDSVRLIDRTSGQETKRIAVDQDPDAAIYDTKRGRALVMNAKAGTVSIIDPASGTAERTIPVKPALEFAAIAKDGTLYINNEDANELEQVDLKLGKAGQAIALTGCQGPTGLAYDAKTDMLISACANGKAAIVSRATGKLAKLLDIGRGPDAVILDAARRLAFIPCGRDGVLEILDLDAAGGITVAGHVTTEIGARTGALDPRDGTLYLPTANFQAPATAGGKPVAIPGSFHVVVVKRQ